MEYRFKDGVDIPTIVGDKMYLVGDTYVLNGGFVDEFITVYLSTREVIHVGFDYMVQEWWEKGLLECINDE